MTTLNDPHSTINPQEETNPLPSPPQQFLAPSPILSHPFQALTVSELLQIVDPSRVTCDSLTGQLRMLSDKNIKDVGEICRVCKSKRTTMEGEERQNRTSKKGYKES